MAALLAALALALAALYHARTQRFTRLQQAAEDGRRNSESLYRNTFDYAAVGIAHASFDGRLLRGNPHLCDMLGYSAQELEGMTIGQITHEADAAEDLVQRQRLLDGEIPTYRLEKRYVRKNGDLVWARISVGLVRGTASENFLVAVIEDIHLRKLTRLAMTSINTELTGEAFMRQTTQTLTKLLGVECALVGEADPASTSRMNARAVVVDGAFVADFSYTLAGTPCETVTANQLYVYAEQVQRKFPTDALLGTMGIESYAAVPLATTAEGTPPGVLAVMSRRPMHTSDAAGTLLPLLAVRVSAELVRQREARKFRDLFDGSPSAIFLVDREGTIRLSSRSGERLFGWEPQALNGRKLAVLFPEDHRTEFDLLFQRFVTAEFKGAIDHGSKDSVALRRDGSVFPSQIQLRILETAEGRMTVAHVQDVAERKQAELALRRFNEELESTVTTRTAELVKARDGAEQANRAKSAFLAAMSHEIRTPMNGVVGMIDVLEQTSLKGSQVEIVKTVRESAYALLNIVDDVLDFSKIEAGQFQVDSEPLSVAAVVEGVCDTLDLLAGKNSVELTLFTDPALPSQVLGDAMRLRQVLLNLAGNAIKFSSATGRSGRVCVRARLVESGSQQAVLEFNVIDNGIGMDQDTLSRLFNPFTQADASTTGRFGGTGLGLSISHGLVSLMGGEIGVSSELDRGSKFSVRLPLPVLPAAPGDGEVDLAGLVCLVVGGSEAAADDLAVYLAHAGAAVHQAADRAAARQWFGDCPPGLCIVVLTGAGAAMDETLAELRASGSTRANLQACFVLVQRGRRRSPAGPIGPGGQPGRRCSAPPCIPEGGGAGRGTGRAGCRAAVLRSRNDARAAVDAGSQCPGPADPGRRGQRDQPEGGAQTATPARFQGRYRRHRPRGLGMFTAQRLRLAAHRPAHAADGWLRTGRGDPRGRGRKAAHAHRRPDRQYREGRSQALSRARHGLHDQAGATGDPQGHAGQVAAGHGQADAGGGRAQAGLAGDCA